jgi:tRNA nucleotidyltransferase (CCA-adding enzyme)
MIYYDKKLQPIFNTLITHSIKPIIVGGFIRDSILGISSKDIDIELYNLKSYKQLEKILQNFGSINSVGKSFGVCKLSFENFELDFSFPRIDNKITQGHKGFNIKIYSNIDFKTASSRRDFTINTIGFDIQKRELLDPFGGINDLKLKILHVVNPQKFSEDPLRVLRAMQFCARFDLRIEEESLKICKEMIQNNMLIQLPKERIFLEFEKLLTQAKKPSIGINFLKAINGFSYFTELNNSLKYTEKLYALDRVRSNQLHIKLLILCYDLKQEDMVNFLKKLTQDKTLFKKILILYKYKDIFSHITNINNYNIYKVAEYISIKEVLLVHKAFKNKDIYKKIENKAQQLNVYEKKLKALIEGKDLIKLGYKPSPKFKTILQKCYEAQMRGEFNTKEEGVKWIKKI